MAFTQFAIPAALALLLAACSRSSSPDLLSDEAVRILAAAPGFTTASAKTCNTKDRGAVAGRRQIVAVDSTQRFPDSEGSFCYAAEIRWKWVSDDGQMCEPPEAGVHRSTAEFRFYGDAWHYHSLDGKQEAGR